MEILEVLDGVTLLAFNSPLFFSNFHCIVLTAQTRPFGVKTCFSFHFPKESGKEG